MGYTKEGLEKFYKNRCKELNKEGLIEYCHEVNVSEDDDRGFIVDIKIQPKQSLQHINIPFTITKTGAIFNEE